MSGIDIAALRRMVAAIEAPDPQGGFESARRFSLGFAPADAAFAQGLAGDALHEVFADNPARHMAATGFALALVRRAAEKRAIVWIEEERAEQEYGGLYPPGFSAFGIDPARLIILRCPSAQDVLKAASDALETGHPVGGVVAAVTDKPKCFDLTASRRLLLAAATARLPIVLLRSHRTGVQSAAVTRWRIAPAPSRSSGADAPGRPAFAAMLERNRHGPCGQWIMEWNNETLAFGAPETGRRKPVPGAVVSLPAERPAQPRRSA